MEFDFIAFYICLVPFPPNRIIFSPQCVFVELYICISQQERGLLINSISLWARSSSGCRSSDPDGEAWGLEEQERCVSADVLRSSTSADQRVCVATVRSSLLNQRVLHNNAKCMISILNSWMMHDVVLCVMRPNSVLNVHICYYCEMSWIMEQSTDFVDFMWAEGLCLVSVLANTKHDGELDRRISQ